MLFFCQGTAVAYLIAVCDILQQSHLLLLGNSRLYTLLVVWTLVELPLSLQRKMTHLQMASALGIAAIFTLIFAALVHLLNDHQDDEEQQQYHNNDDHSTTTKNWTLHDMLWPNQGNIIAAIAACPIILFAFSCQVNVCAIFQELPLTPSVVLVVVEDDSIRTTTRQQHHHHHQVVVQRQRRVNDPQQQKEPLVTRPLAPHLV